MAKYDVLERFQSHGYSVLEFVSSNHFRITGNAPTWLATCEPPEHEQIVELTLRPMDSDEESLSFWSRNSQTRDLGILRYSSGDMSGASRVFAISINDDKFLALCPSDRAMDQNSKMTVDDWPGVPVSRVLVAEDHPINLRLLKHILIANGFSVTAVNDGSQAKEQLSVNQFDVAILDWKMPGMNGTDVIRDLRKNSKSPNQRVPAIALTAYDGDYDREKCISAGFDACLGKPFQLDELVATVSSFSTSNDV